MIEKVLNWIKAHSPSGVLNWEGGEPYPEVTGYMIPTLLKYGEKKLARQYADWLLSIQNEDGSFNGIDGLPRTFDTSACYEGLTAIGQEDAALRAKKWLQSLYLECGALPIVPSDEHTHIYTARASGLINSRYGRSFWSFDGSWDVRWSDEQRTHYIAYGLEGLHMLNVDITDPLLASYDRYGQGLMPYMVATNWQSLGGKDISATCQMAMLYRLHDMNADAMLKAVENDFAVNGIRLSWSVKFYLDAKAVK